MTTPTPTGYHPGDQVAGFQLVPISSIVVLPNRMRKVFEGVTGLSESIQRLGLIHPLVVHHPTPDGKHRLCSGERRYRALVLAGWTEVPVRFCGDDPELDKEIELRENLERKSLSWDEEIEGERQLHELLVKIHGESPRGAPSSDPGWSMAKTAELRNQDRSHTSQRIGLAKKFRDDPKLKEKLSHLPMGVAIREARRLEKAEKTHGMIKAGKMEINASILHGSALDLLPTLADGSIDLLLTDPPYGITNLDVGAMNATDNLTQAAAFKLFHDCCPDLFRVMKPSRHIYVFCTTGSLESFSTSLQGVGFELQPYPLVWDKMTTTAPFNGKAYQPSYELIIFGWKPPHERRLSRPEKSLIQSKVVPVVDRLHVFQKPRKLLRLLIEESTNMGDAILDPFAGSGEVILTARTLGRSATGIELDQTHWSICQSRLNSEKEVK